MKFKLLSKEQFDALTTDQQSYYLEQKAAHDSEILEAKIAEASKTAAEAATTELKTENEGLKTEIAAVKVQMDERDVKVEAAMAEMSRIKAGEKSANTKTLANDIYETLTKGEGRAAFEATKSKQPFKLDVDSAFKAVGTMGVTAGTTQSQWVDNVSYPHEQVQARNIIPVYNTTRDSIKYVQFSKKEGSIGSVAPGALKPQLDYNTTPVTAPVVKIAGWVSVQEEFLDDVDGAAEWLANELPQAYMDEETRQVFKGTGTANELSGLYSVWASNLTLPKGTVTNASNNWDKIAAALTQTRRSLRPGDAIWTSPEAYMELLINKGNTLEYTYPIVSDTNGTLRMGGIPIYFHTIFTANQGLAGNFRRGTALFQRKGITLRTSTEHDTNFTHNLVTYLIEARVALPCYFPESFVRINFAVTT